MAIFIFLALMTLSQTASSTRPSTIYGWNKYIEYTPGNTNLIIGAPHGGYEKPANLQDRHAGCWDGQRCIYNHTCGVYNATKCKTLIHQDEYTFEVAELLTEGYYNLSGKWPHLICNRLHRSKLDANRDLPEATFYDPESIRAWYDFHKFINQAKTAIDGPGLYLDIHGHRHDPQWAEFGYRFYGKDLDSDNIDPNNSSIRNLASTATVSFEELLRGKSSLGGFLQAAGYESVPSHTNPHPNGRKYLRGGYNTDRYGSQHGGNFDAIQIETPLSFKKNDTRPAYSEALSKAVWSFMSKYYPQTSAATSIYSNGRKMALMPLFSFCFCLASFYF